MAEYAMLIEYKYCTGCHACEVSCRNEKKMPLTEGGIKINEMGPIKMSNGKWLWDYVPVPSDLCDLCADRLAEGTTAPCVLHCLGACMEIVKVDEIGQALAGKSNKVAVYLP